MLPAPSLGGTFPLLTGNADLTREHVHALRRRTKENARAVPWGPWSPLSVWAAYPWGCGRVTSVFTEQDARCAFPVFQGFPLISARYLWLPGPPSFAFQKVESMACCFWTNNRSVLRLRTSFKKKKITATQLPIQSLAS